MKTETDNTSIHADLQVHKESTPLNDTDKNTMVWIHGNITQEKNGQIEPNNFRQDIYTERVIIKKEIDESTYKEEEDERKDIEFKIEIDDDFYGKYKEEMDKIDETQPKLNTTDQPSEITSIDKTLIKPVKKGSTCNVCFKVFTHRSNLSKHERIHTGSRPYNCNQCLKTFVQRSHLKTHLKLHEGVRYPCEYCNKVFTQTNNLRIHLRKHTGDKSFVCNYCDKKYSDRRALIFHIEATHLNSRPHNCYVCHKKFAQKSTLKCHLKIHTGNRPFECSVCQFTCTEKRYLERHMRIHTGEKPFSCDICRRAFSQPGNLKTHKKLHTAEAK